LGVVGPDAAAADGGSHLPPPDTDAMFSLKW
jgi:hypothetical protein